MLEDSFTNTNGTAIADHSPDVGTGSYIVHPASSAGTKPTINSNRYQPGSSTFQFVVFDGDTPDDLLIEVDLITVSGTSGSTGSGIVGRANTSGSTTGYFFRISGPQALLQVIVSGSSTTLGTVNATFGGVSWKMQLELVGTSVKAYAQALSGANSGEWYDGSNFQSERTPMFDVTDSGISGGKVGLSNWSSGSPFDNLEATEIESASLKFFSNSQGILGTLTQGGIFEEL